MRKITDQQMQVLINILQELPAKTSFNAILMLQNLELIKKDEPQKEAVPQTVIKEQ